MFNRAIISIFLLIPLACGVSSPVMADGRASGSVQQGGGAQESMVVDSTQAEQQQPQNSDLKESLADHDEQMGVKLFVESWTGDLDVLTDKRIIRVLTVYGLGRYFLDGGQEKGLTYELFKSFEEEVNKEKATNHLRIHVVFIPVARDQLIPGLLSGRGDIAAAGLTITPEREALVDFSNPATKDLSEILVTGPAAPQIAAIEDLAGHSILVRASSSYRSSLDALNLRFRQQGLEEIEIEDAPEQLEDEDILEMVNTGMLEWAVVDDYKAAIWAEVFENLTVRRDLQFRQGGRIAYAMRKNSPQLKAAVNTFLKTNQQGTLKGNVLFNRYFRDFDWAKNALAPDSLHRFEEVAGIFAKYGTEYGIDYLMVAAQGYQESQLNQNAKSAAGAVGIMQLLPSTAADANVGIPDIYSVDSNIHAGIKYLNFIRNRYFSDLGMDAFNRTLFSFASYNAGPGRVKKLRDKAAQQGYDPNVWFDNVEVIAAKEIGRETVQYVANILKYYAAYRFSVQQELEREAARVGAGIKRE